MKNNRKITQNLHHRKTSLGYLFQVEINSSKLHLFCIPKTEFKTYYFDLPLTGAMGFYHVENSFYLGGGKNWSLFLAHFRKILTSGEVTELQKMPTPKAGFAMTQWKEKGSLFTLGGYN